MNKYHKIADFHGQRRTAVGSSDIPVLAGLARQYGSTTLRLWEEKTGRREGFAGNQRTHWGHKLEGQVLHEFLVRRYGDQDADEFMTAKRRGKSTVAFKSDTECRMPERPYCLAHADLIVATADEAPYIVEAKTTGMMSGKRREGQVFSGYDPDDLTAQGIPDAVFLQVQWQMMVYDVPTAWVAVLIDTADYREYGPIAADRKVQERMLALAERFWRLVETDTQPAPETWDDVVHLFPHQTNTTAMVSGDDETRVRGMIERGKTLAAKVKELEDELDDIKNAIGVLLGENAVLTGGEGNVLAKSSEHTRESVSLSDIKKKATELEAQLRTAGLVKASTFRTVRF